MSSTAEFPRSSDEVRCSYHADVMTRLRCSRCGKPICPRCGVRTPVGLRCPECAGVRGLPTYATDTPTLLRAGVAGFATAAAVGVILGYWPHWHFYLALVMGFGVAEVIARLSANKRGVDLQIVAMAAVAAGVLVSRVVLANRLGVTWDMISNFSPRIERAMYLQPVPDGIFAALALLIAWYRFR
jgi:hypothetical protein